MAYTLRTKDNAGDLGRAADQNESVDNDIHFEADHADAVSPWMPDKPPASPGALDDEFSTPGAIPGAWSEYDPDGKTTWTVDYGGAKAVVATSAANNANGIYQDLPAGDFTVVVKVASSATETNYFSAGIGLWEDPTGDNEQACWVITRDATAGFPMRLECNTYTNHTTVAIAKIAAATFGYSEFVYLRLRRNAANYYCDFSLGGLGWRQASAAITFVFTPTKIGLWVNNINTGLTPVARFQFFRYVASDLTLQGVMQGGRR